MQAALAATLATALVAGTTGTAYAAVTLTTGHVDILDVDYDGTNLTLSVLDSTGTTPVERPPSDVTIQVPSSVRVPVPAGTAWSFLGSGGYAWVLDQSPVAGQIWAGWNTTGIAANALSGNKVRFKLAGVTGPGGFSVYGVDAFGSPVKLFDSGDGTPDYLDVPRNTHAHYNWGFDKAGTYAVTFEVTAKRADSTTVTTGEKTYTFVVQP
ncbi:choice-of-anchor M domain-containing protein [Dactylosporangium sp. AC04546]|uniref:choice-of-anchor M domain-containing protein n=1 Tax=Dactylosporangium sp. AC04546 TaxID=2862460 RepID=UPI001EDFDCA6|nr:choice-of-anchor M domain-containing protein [Dactylosporangium sp. AC04546]WVK88711.1 choice-of-anchor M domain-containing protein [Dactylosporangium sp. AC04546]